MGKKRRSRRQNQLSRRRNGDFARALGLSLDLTARGLGIRSQRYAMIVDDGVVRKLNVEAAPAKVEASSAEALLKQL